MIVEDEPPIIRYLSKLLALHCREFEVVATADNGAEALEKIGAVKPDVVLTDIKMPVMDGIELVKTLHTDYPEIYSVFVSGYQDFAYAREAIQSRVLDYLLKPVDPEQLHELLNKLAVRLDRDYHAAGVKLLAGLIANLPVNDAAAAKYLNHPSFGAVLIRKGPLPSRWRNKSFDPEELCFFSHWGAADFQKLLGVKGAWLMAGRDESEILVIAAMDPGDRFAATALLANFGAAPDFHTVVYSAVPFALKEIAANVARVFDAANQLTVIGKDQVCADTLLLRASHREPPILNSSLEKKLEFLIGGRLLQNLHDELRSLFQAWEAQNRTQIWVEKILRQILGMMERYSVNLSADASLNLDKQLEEALSSAANFEGLCKYFWEMAAEILAPADSGITPKRVPPAELLQKAEAYIRKNLAETVTLQELCGAMEVSQPYLSRLFRKFKNQSFIEYLNDIRINEAKRLMAEYPEMLLKDVAALVGYNDPYYFSRIFKSVTGLAPSEYKSA